jgi:hypothetical protein
MKFEFLQTLAGSKDTFPDSKKIEIKYGWKEYEMRNNFAYKSSLRFQLDFELKFRDVSMS